jgi:hypothetical protein
MIDAPISCVRMRDLERPGRYQGWDPRASLRPGAGDLVASIIL